LIDEYGHKGVDLSKIFHYLWLYCFNGIRKEDFVMKIKSNFLCYAVLFILYLLIFAACGNPASNNPNENPTDNTLVKFNNLEQFSVTVYSDSQRQQAIATIAAFGSSTVPATPILTGTPFYPTFHLDLFGIQGISIPYNGPAITTIVEENKTTSVSIPKLESIETNFAYIKIINNSTSSLTLQQGNSEKSPLGGGPTIITENKTAVFEITPGPSSGYSIMRSSTPVAFPAGFTEFRQGIIYSFIFNGTSLVNEKEEVTHDIVVPGGYLSEKFAWLTANAMSDTAYFIEVDKDETIVPQTLSYSGKSGITIILSGDMIMRTINFSTANSFLTVDTGVTLILYNNITLNGRSNSGSMVNIGYNGTVIMHTGTKISGNNTSSSGGGVYVRGTFTMNGGEINGNTTTFRGGRVNVSSGTFTMNGGKITGNTASYGGGVYISGGIFRMNGGEIIGNTADGRPNGYDSRGGGVCTGGGTFRMSGGVIYGSSATTGLRNTAIDGGAALYRYDGTVQYGTSSGNTFYPSGNLDTTNTTIRIVNGNLQTN
jgi:hypothetical protein